jgi:predicted nuclease of predicted toxin-antitoxin system
VAKAVVRGLRERGVNVLTVTEAGTLGASDQDHIQRARDEGRTIFSQDNDFLRLHAAGIEHAGIVYAPQHISTGQIIHGLMLIYQILDPEEMYGHVEYL